MTERLLSFSIAAAIAFTVQIAAIFVAKIVSTGMDCGILEQRICTLPVFLDGVAYLAASINVYLLGIPTILLALLFGGVWRMYRELRASGMRRRDFLGQQ